MAWHGLAWHGMAWHRSGQRRVGVRVWVRANKKGQHVWVSARQTDNKGSRRDSSARGWEGHDVAHRVGSDNTVLIKFD